MRREEIRILVIDDEEDIRFALTELFKFQGWNSSSADSVEEGLRLFQRTRPDLVLIDYYMPVVNGVEGVRRLRKLNPEVPIIVFTIDESQETADAFLAAGASDFVIKPIKAPDLVSRINLHLRLLAQDRERARQYHLTKGLSTATLDLIAEYMREHGGYVSASEIAEGSGLAYQTVYRYLQYMIQEKQVEVTSTYGKIGRPKQLYRLR